MSTVSLPVRATTLLATTLLFSAAAQGQALEVESSIGQRSAAPVSRQYQSLYGGEALAAGSLKTGAGADNVLLPALVAIPPEIHGGTEPLSGLSTFGWARLGAGDLGVNVGAKAVGMVPGGANYLAQSSAAARLQDVVTIGGAGNVRLRLDAEVLFWSTYSLHDLNRDTSGDNTNADNGFYAKINYWWRGGSFDFIACTWWPRCGDAGVGPGLTSFSREIELAAGTELWISAEMQAFASAGLYNPSADSLNGGFANTSIDAWNSQRNGITLLSSGATLSARTGHDYVWRPHDLTAPAAVPEPASAALVLVALAAAGARRRWPMGRSAPACARLRAA